MRLTRSPVSTPLLRGLVFYAPHRMVQLRALRRASACVTDLDNCIPPTGCVALGQLVNNDDLSGNKNTVHPKLDAERCDLLTASGRVDSLLHTDATACEPRASVNTLFGGVPLDWIRAGRIHRDDRAEYARLVVRQLRCDKVSWLPSVIASASVFAVGKSSGWFARDVEQPRSIHGGSAPSEAPAPGWRHGAPRA